MALAARATHSHGIIVSWQGQRGNRSSWSSSPASTRSHWFKKQAGKTEKQKAYDMYYVTNGWWWGWSDVTNTSVAWPGMVTNSCVALTVASQSRVVTRLCYSSWKWPCWTSLRRQLSHSRCRTLSPVSSAREHAEAAPHSTTAPHFKVMHAGRCSEREEVAIRSHERKMPTSLRHPPFLIFPSTPQVSTTLKT